MSSMETVSKIPANVQAEGALLGAILLDNESLKLAQTQLSPEDFYSERNRVVYRAMLRRAGGAS